MPERGRKGATGERNINNCLKRWHKLDNALFENPCRDGSKAKIEEFNDPTNDKHTLLDIKHRLLKEHGKLEKALWLKIRSTIILKYDDEK